MTTKNRNFENKFERAMDKLAEKTNKDLNLSNSDESYEEYSPKEIEYIDRYKPIALYRMEDEELYEIITKHKFNDEKIENEIKEFVKLINIKGDDYGWNIIDEGKKKKLFINDKSSKKEALNKKQFENKKTNEEYYHSNNNYYNKKYYSSNKYYSNKNSNYNYNKNYYNKNNFINDKNPTEEKITETTEKIIKEGEEQVLEQTNDNEINYNKTNYYKNNNYYSNYNSYRGVRGEKRGRGFNRGRGRYRSNNYSSREDWIFEKEFGREQTDKIQEEHQDNLLLDNCIVKNETDDDNNRLKEIGINNQTQEEDLNENDNAEENFIEEEEIHKSQVETIHKEKENIKEENIFVDNKEKNVRYETIQVEQIFESNNINSISPNKNQNISFNNQTTNTNKFEIESQNSKSKNNIDISSSTLNIQNENNSKEIKKKQITNTFSEVVSSNVQNFSFIGTSNNSNRNNTNVISSNTNINLSSSNNNINNNSSSNNNNNSNKQYSSVSPQINVNKNETNNKFNIPNNNTNLNNNNFNQPQNIPNLNINANQDLYNAYQMQMSALLSQNMSGGLGQQQVYPMPLFYYPPSASPANAADPNINYSNFMPYMGYPMSYYVHPQQMTQQQGNLKDGNDMQNKNRKMNNYDYNAQQQIPQNNVQGFPYAPYFYMNSQYPFGSAVNGMNTGMGMNMMGYNLDSMSNMNPMNLNSNYDPQNFPQKK